MYVVPVLAAVDYTSGNTWKFVWMNLAKLLVPLRGGQD